VATAAVVRAAGVQAAEAGELVHRRSAELGHGRGPGQTEL
jgi:hypothetical protein